MRVLIVDDSRETIETLKRVLTLRGHRVMGALSAKEALIVLAKDTEPIDVVLTDYCMPAMNGIQLLQKIREQNVLLPVILMTAYMDNDIKRRALENHCNAVIEKPLEMNYVNELMEKVVNES